MYERPRVLKSSAVTGAFASSGDPTGHGACAKAGSATSMAVITITLTRARASELRETINMSGTRNLERSEIAVLHKDRLAANRFGKLDDQHVFPALGPDHPKIAAALGFGQRERQGRHIAGLRAADVCNGRARP